MPARTMSTSQSLKVHIANLLWFSHRGCANLIELALVATIRPVFEICYGLSGNQYRWVEVDHARDVLGYLPKDSHEGR